MIEPVGGRGRIDRGGDFEGPLSRIVEPMPDAPSDLPADARAEPVCAPPGLGLVLTGGGARAAYQVGFLRCLARHMPTLAVPIVTGVSAGAINAAFLASHRGPLDRGIDKLTGLWKQLTPEKVFEVGSMSLFGDLARWGVRLVSGGSRVAPAPRSLVDTAPLDQFLRRALGTVDGEIAGIRENLAEQRLRAVALTTLKYSTGQTVTWVEGCQIEEWQRPNRVGIMGRITVDHIMASAALPLIFPAVRLGDSWYGDGGIRMSTPLAPAIHLGADRILAVSTRHLKPDGGTNPPAITGYPPPAQVAGTLLNAIFLDSIDQDALRLERINRLLERLPAAERDGLRPIKLLVLRPSVDLGRLSAEFEPKLPGAFRFLTRGLGTRETQSPDVLSLLMFQTDYLARLIEIGEADAEARLDEIAALLAD